MVYKNISIPQPLQVTISTLIKKSYKSHPHDEISGNTKIIKEKLLQKIHYQNGLSKQQLI